TAKPGGQGQFLLALHQHFESEKNQIRAAAQFDCIEGKNRSGENGGKSEPHGTSVEDASGRNAECGSNSRRPSLRDAAAQDVGCVRTGGEIEQDAGYEEQSKVMDAEH